MTISGIAQLSGRIKYAPPTPTSDWSSNPMWLTDVLESLPCSVRKEEEYTLVADDEKTINFGSLSSVNLIVVKVAPNVGVPPSPGFPNGVVAAPNPIVVRLTSTAGIAQAVAVDGFLFLLSAGVPYTAMSISRSAGVQTTVRIQMFATGS